MSLRSISTFVVFSVSLVFSQFSYQVSGGYYDQAGNTDYKYYNAGFSVTSYGDIVLGGLTVKDSEFLLSVDKNFSTYAGEDYEDDQNILFLFDLWANGKFSPFIIAEKSFDTFRGIKDRSNFGIGAKYRVIGDMLSVSAAFLSESEEVIGKNRVYEYADYGDSLGLYTFSDHPSIKPSQYSRISIRPKLKLPIGENFYFQSEYFYKPAGDDVLTDWKNKFTIKTAAEWLSIDISYNLKEDSRPAPKYFMKYSDQFAHTATFENPGSKVKPENRPVIDRTPAQSKEDGFGEYYVTNYKKADTTLRVGFSISF
ncbi:MAG: hypothetical protein VYA83_05295 [Candidatus Neomarinimicrobiota bacterium]|nr:hypothetical protein [Candidatus Neomarinimicrobiota bacterium]